MKKIAIYTICVALLFSFTGCSEANQLKNTGLEVINALKNQNIEKLAELTHPDKGIRFSPYATIDTKKDIILKEYELVEAFKDDKIYQWGVYDGSGEPIKKTFKNYINEFVYDEDFVNAPDVGINEIINTGNSLNNLDKVYANAEYIEYHFKGFNQQYDGMDWVSLRLVFEKSEQKYKLIGIIHDQWTI